MELQKQERLAAALDPALDLAQVSGNSAELLLYSWGFICSLLGPFHFMQQMLNVPYYCACTGSAHGERGRMYY